MSTDETEVQKVEADVKSVAEKIEEFFAHLFHHVDPSCHEALKAAQATTSAAVIVTNPTTAPVASTGATVETTPAPAAGTAEAAPETTGAA